MVSDEFGFSSFISFSLSFRKVVRDKTHKEERLI